jgi:hypothetical protein
LLAVEFSSVTYPAIWRCGCECGGCASLKEMIHLQWETTASPERDVMSPAGDLLASPNFGICDTTHQILKSLNNIVIDSFYQSKKNSLFHRNKSCPSVSSSQIKSKKKRE